MLNTKYEILSTKQYQMTMTKIQNKTGFGIRILGFKNLFRI